MLLWHATFVGHYGSPSPDFVNLNPNFTFLRTYLPLLMLSMTHRSLLLSHFVNYVPETEYKDFSNNRQSPTLAFLCTLQSVCICSLTPSTSKRHWTKVSYWPLFLQQFILLVGSVPLPVIPVTASVTDIWYELLVLL